ncbi:hypothetical protein [Hymenobacter bucti]|uniref:DUF2306 domain-containing protein n=1 Tax=Hymenobacter bucti TaxID=1844114 RepID=A0ABW4QWG0_9BACT
MAFLLFSPVSTLHLLAALAALVTGTAVLYRPKATRAHRRLGWAYVGSMGVVLLTAFRIYTLFGRFGLVHWGAVGSAGALLLGVGAAVGRAAIPAWLRWHYLGMGVSVTGLYATFVVESTYRLFPAAYFWWSTLGSGSVVLAVGGWLLSRQYAAWAAAYGVAQKPGRRLAPS